MIKKKNTAPRVVFNPQNRLSSPVEKLVIFRQQPSLRAEEEIFFNTNEGHVLAAGSITPKILHSKSVADLLHERVLNKKIARIRQEAYELAIYSCEVREKAMFHPKIDLNLHDIPSFAELLQSKTPLVSSKTFSMGVLVFLSMGIILPLAGLNMFTRVTAQKISLAAAGKEGVARILAAGKALSFFDFAQANQAFLQSAQNFKFARQELHDQNAIFSAFLAMLPVMKNKITTVNALIALGARLAESGRYLTQAASAWDDKRLVALTDKLSASSSGLFSALSTVESALQSVQDMDPSLLSAYDLDLWKAIRYELPDFAQALKKSLLLHDLGLHILGDTRMQRYLLVFQNNGELRPTGGFMGSFALVDIFQGKIKHLEVPGGGFYDLSGGLEENINPPRALHLLTNRWETHDANWSPDFAESAMKLAWFYEHAAGRTVDGIIAFNADVIPSFLELLGPLELPRYRKTLTSANFIEETQKAVEQEYDRVENKPKQIIGDALPLLLERLFSADHATWLHLMTILSQSLAQKDIQMFFTDSETEDTIERLGWSGKLPALQPDEDTLLIVHTNLGGRKTDRVIKDTVKYTVQKNKEDHSLVSTLKITRTHMGEKGDPFFGARNNDYLRVYVPLNARLISAEGFDQIDPGLFSVSPASYQNDPEWTEREKNAVVDELSHTTISEEHGRTVFANWLQIDPGESKTVILRYQLPFFLGEKDGVENSNTVQAFVPQPYRLLFQRQSGIQPIDFQFQWDGPSTEAFKDFTVTGAKEPFQPWFDTDGVHYHHLELKQDIYLSFFLN